MRIAVVGTGISGLVAARRLCAEHDLTVYEAADRIGGHTHTVDVTEGGRELRVDTGFIVFNEKTYREFCKLLRELGVSWQESDMSFSARCDATGLEYNGTSLNGLFAQRSNLLRPSFWRMTRDILRFYREAIEVLDEGHPDVTLGEYLDRNGYSEIFCEKHMIPMGAAIWSSRPEEMRSFPMRFLVQFFHNHGFLLVDGRPQWLVVRGGSSEYVAPLVEPFRDSIRKGSPVASVARVPGGVRVTTTGGDAEVYDRVVLATHSDQSLRMLSDATPLERELLGAFRYQENDVVLHTDASLMPRKRRAWASWNYHVTDPPSELPTVTYWMNNLQSLDAREQYLVTLNRTADIAPDRILRRFTYHHPIFSPEAVRSQERHGEIDGTHGVHFCGAYWRYGFHEDGVLSGLRVAERIAAEVAVS